MFGWLKEPTKEECLTRAAYHDAQARVFAEYAKRDWFSRAELDALAEHRGLAEKYKLMASSKRDIEKDLMEKSLAILVDGITTAQGGLAPALHMGRRKGLEKAAKDALEVLKTAMGKYFITQQMDF